MTTPIAPTAPNVIPTPTSGDTGRFFFLVETAAGAMGGGGGGGAGGGGDGSVQASILPPITQKTY